MLDFCGEFPPGSVRIEWNDTARPPHPAIEELKLAWPRHVEEATRRGGILFNGKLVRYLGHELRNNAVVIQAEPTDYATFYCTNYLNHSRGDEIGWERFANAIGISANVITADGWLVYGRRGARVACHPGMVHAFGGTIEPSDRDDAGGLDAFASMDRELREELKLSPTEVIDLICLGQIRDPVIRQPELVFDAALRLTRRQLEERLGPNDVEHDEIVALRDSQGEFSGFLADTPSAVPILVGALCLHARRTFGLAGYDRLLDAIR